MTEMGNSKSKYPLESTTYMSRHVGPGVRKTGLTLSNHNTKTEVFRSTFHDTYAFRMTSKKTIDSLDTQKKFVTTFKKTTADEMKKIEAKIKNDHRKSVEAKNVHALPSEYEFRGKPEPDTYGREPFDVV